MGNLWLKIKIWTKIILAVALLIFALLFILFNRGKPVTVWLWGGIETTVLDLLFFTVLFSVVGTILVGTVFRTIRQVRQVREQGRQAKLANDMAEMRAKAAMLQTKPAEEK